jgi:hypothetical protein
MQQSAILQMQRQAGNAQVQRYLADQHLQRDATAMVASRARRPSPRR